LLPKTPKPRIEITYKNECKAQNSRAFRRGFRNGPGFGLKRNKQAGNFL